MYCWLTVVDQPRDCRAYANHQASLQQAAQRGSRHHCSWHCMHGWLRQVASHQKYSSIELIWASHTCWAAPPICVMATACRQRTLLTAPSFPRCFAECTRVCRSCCCICAIAYESMYACVQLQTHGDDGADANGSGYDPRASCCSRRQRLPRQPRLPASDSRCTHAPQDEFAEHDSKPAGRHGTGEWRRAHRTAGLAVSQPAAPVSPALPA